MVMKKKKIFRDNFLPPTFKLLDESGIFTSDKEDYITKRLSDKGFISEARIVAQNTISKYSYCDDNDPTDSEFNITLGGSLDILNPNGGTCSSPICKHNETMNIARTAGLFAKKLFITDYLTAYLSKSEEQSVVSEMTTIISSVKLLAPLIDEGIVTFRTPLSGYCEHCNDRVSDEITNFLNSNIYLDSSLEVTCISKETDFTILMVSAPDLLKFGVTALMLGILKENQKNIPWLKINERVTVNAKKYPYLLKILKKEYRERLQNIVHGVNSANKTSSLFMSKSEMESLFLSSIDKKTPHKSDLNKLETMKSISLPWVGELDIPQIIKLRSESSSSLEALQNLLVVGFMQGGHNKTDEIISELISEVAKLKQELTSYNIVKNSHNRYSIGLGSLAITLVFYGLASQVPAAGVGSVAALLAAISHMHGTDKELKEKETKIITSPAYALLKANELLSCNE